MLVTVAGVIGLVAVPVRGAAAAPGVNPSGYTVFDLGAGFFPFSMNTSGVVVGTVPDPQTGHSQTAIWQGGSSSVLPKPAPPAGYQECDADFRVWINAAGVVAGSVQFCDNKSTDNDIVAPYIWEPANGTYSTPRAASSAQAPGSTEDVYGINAANDLLLSLNPASTHRSVQITGAFGASPQTVPNATYPVGLAAADQFVFIDANGVSRIASLSSPGNSTTLGFDAQAISNNGYVVGRNSGRTTTFLRSPTGIQTNPPGGMNGLRGYGRVNSSGNIVTNDPAFIPLGATTATALASLFPADTDFDATNLYGDGLNDNNDVFGTGYMNSDSQFHGFVLMTPAKTPPVVNSTGDTPAASSGSKGCDTGRTVTINGQTKPECTLRAAIQAENAGSVTDKTITFTLPSGTFPTIQPTTALPALTAAGVTIDGTITDPKFPTVTLSGFSLPEKVASLEVSGGQDVVQDMAFTANENELLADAKVGHDTVRASSFADATSAAITVQDSPGNVIGGSSAEDRNVVRSAQVGVEVVGAAAAGTRVIGNWLGVSADGTSGGGIRVGVLSLDAPGTVVGGPSTRPGAAPGNVIDPQEDRAALGTSGAQGFGVFVAGRTATVTGTQVQGNLIGLLPDGVTAAQAGSTTGIAVSGRISGGIVGGQGSGQGNVVAGFSSSGVKVTGTLVTSVQVLGNLLGTDATGHTCVNKGSGAGIGVDGARLTTVGLPGAGRNVASCDALGIETVQKSSPTYAFGVTVPGTDNVTQTGSLATAVSGNIVGPFADGASVDHGSGEGTFVQKYGISLGGTGDTAGPNNQVSGNAIGIALAGANETAYGNLVGTDANGTTAVPNGYGIATPAPPSGATVPPATSVRIGVPGQKANVVAGNVDDLALGAPATVQNNRIGTTPDGLSVLPHASEADTTVVAQASGLNDYGAEVTVLKQAGGSVIGGTRPGFGNVIGGSTVAGIKAVAPVTVQGNDIGVGADGTSRIANGVGVSVDALGATIGAPAAAPGSGGNTIARNTGDAISIAPSAVGVTVLSNAIHDNATGIDLVGPNSNAGLAAPSIDAVAQDGKGHSVAFVSGVTEGSTVQLFQAANCPTQIDQPGQGAQLVQTGIADGTTITLVAPLLTVGSDIVATVTTKTGTSTFSRCAAVSPAAAGTLSEPDAAPGDTDTAAGAGFAAGETVQASVHSTPVPLGTRPADGNGRVSFTFRVPAGLTTGAHYVLLTGLSSGHGVAVPLTVYGPPTATRSLEATASNHAVTIAWSAPASPTGTPLTGYRVQRSTNGHTFSTLHSQTARTYIDRAVAGGRRYYYRILALNRAGTSPAGSIVDAVPFTAPSAPRTLRVNPARSALTVSWSAPAYTNGAAVTGYRVQYATCTIGSKHCAIRTLTVRSRSTTIRHLSAKHLYRVRVLAVNRAGVGPATPPRTGRPGR